MTKSTEYTAWTNMKQRCENPQSEGYPRYGARGITVCERWHVFEAFLEDMGRKPSPEHSIERIDNDGHYAPDNCRWATRLEQGMNKRNNHWVTHEGVTLHLAEWARQAGVSVDTFWRRINRYGWSFDRAIRAPARIYGAGRRHDAKRKD